MAPIGDYTNQCPGCGTLCTSLPKTSIQLVFHRVFSVRGVFPEHYCQCGKYWYTREIPRSLAKRGRPRLGKTHKPSPEGKRRQNERRKAVKARGTTKYRYSGYHLIQNVLDVGEVPNYFGRLKYHEARYKKAGLPWVQPKRAPWGFRLLGSRRYDLPDLVVKGLIRIYNHAVYTPKPKRARDRTPRRRTQSETILRLEQSLLDPNLPLARYNILNKMLEEELLLRDRRIYAEERPYSGGEEHFPLFAHDQWEKRKASKNLSSFLGPPRGRRH